MVDVVSQGSVRRGRFSPYLPIDHPDIKEFLEIGTEGNPIQELTHGVTVSNKWMEEMRDGDVEKRTVWAKVLQSRSEIGYPYILFRDNDSPSLTATNSLKNIFLLGTPDTNTKQLNWLIPVVIDETVV